MKIYSFYKNKNDKVRIIISSPSYFEATNMVCEMYDDASSIYNFKEYKIEDVKNIDEFCKCLNISKEYIDFPICLSETQYKLLKKNQIIKTPYNYNEISNIVKSVVDKSIIDNKYNSALIYKNEKTMENCMDRIRLKNSTKNNYENDNEDLELLNNISNNISYILDSYVENLKNKNNKEDIKRELINIYDKCIENISGKTNKYEIHK